MRLHENPNLFRQAVAATAQSKGIPEIYIEKDYWVSFALKEIFTHPIGKETIFKGGTALSKSFELIDRFSEDIDLVVKKCPSETGNQLKRKIKRIGEIVSTRLPEIEVPGLTHRQGMIRKTAHSYAHFFEGEYGQVRDTIVIEATWLGNTEPYQKRKLESYITEMMIERGQEDLVLEYELQAFEVNVLSPSRTLCEKIMSLVRFSHGETAIDDLKQKIRHTYDLHKLLENDDLNEFFNSTEFDKLLLAVAQDDVTSFKNNNTWLAKHPSEALIFAELNEIWPKLSPTYSGNFQNLVYGGFPPESAILNTLTRIKDRLSPIEWTVNIR